MKFTLPIHAAVGDWFARSVRVLSIDGTLAEEHDHKKQPQTTFNKVSGRIRSWA